MFSRFLNFLESKKGFYWAVSTISILSALLRLVRITFPSSRVFDEVYSPVFGWKLLHGQSYFDIHPVLAELSHGMGLMLFGDTPLGWRISPWIWGIIFCWATAFVAYLLTNRRLTGVLAALLVSLDTAYFIYGRTGLPDMFLLSQIALSIAFFLASIRANDRKSSMIYASICGIFIGNVISTKWLGIAILGVIWSWIIIYSSLIRLQRHEILQNVKILLPRIERRFCFIFFFVLPILVYFIWLIPMLVWPADMSQQGAPADIWGKIVWWHTSVWNYNVNLTATHPYSSKWWQWPLVIHPVLFFWEQAEGGRRVINATGNVFLWWSGIVALVASAFSLLYKFRPKVLWLVVSALGFWLPWIKIGRIAFNYHYFETLFFEIILMSIILTYLLNRPKYRPFVVVFFTVIFISFVLLYPEATGMLIPKSIPTINFFFPF